MRYGRALPTTQRDLNRDALRKAPSAEWGMQAYQGRLRLRWKWAAPYAFLLILASSPALQLLLPDGYSGLVKSLGHGRRALPMTSDIAPFVVAGFVVFCLVLATYVGRMLIAGFEQKVMFEIDSVGARSFGVLWLPDRGIEWREVQSALSNRDGIALVGLTSEGLRRVVGISLMAQERTEVVDAICVHRPDLGPQLEWK